MGTDCAVVMRENADVHLANIAAALRANYLALFIGLLLVMGALYLSSLIVSVAIGSVQNYYALLPSSNRPAARRKGRQAATDDDVTYPDELAASGALASNMQDSDNSRIRARLAALKVKYAAYNTQSAEYAVNHPSYEPNLMDEEILSRANDDFKSIRTAPSSTSY